MHNASARQSSCAKITYFRVSPLLNRLVLMQMREGSRTDAQLTWWSMSIRSADPTKQLHKNNLFNSGLVIWSNLGIIPTVLSRGR